MVEVPEQRMEMGHRRKRPEHPHVHYSHRSAWLRAFVLGANDGLVSISSLMLGVGGGSDAFALMKLAGIAGWIAGALSMACGEYISVASQMDCEKADIEKERQEQLKGPDAQQRELDELTFIYAERGISEDLARQVGSVPPTVLSMFECRLPNLTTHFSQSGSQPLSDVHFFPVLQTRPDGQLPHALFS